MSNAKPIICSGCDGFRSAQPILPSTDLEAAIVARPDPSWGETLCAFVTLKDGAAAEPAEIIAFCRERLAHFKAPRHVIFGPLPETSRGKIEKFVLRERARDGA